MALEHFVVRLLYFVGIACVCAVAYKLFFPDLKKKLKLPPGPSGIPFLGSFPFWSNDLPRLLKSLSKEYGPVCSLFLGRKCFFVVDDFDAMKEVCTKEEFLDRPPGYFSISPIHTNLIEIGGSQWKHHRKFQESTFRFLGMTKKETHIYALGEIQKAMSAIANKSTEPCINLEEIISAAMDNIVYFILYGKEFEPDHPYIRQLPLMDEAISMTYRWEEVSVFKPWLNLLLSITSSKLKREYERRIMYVAEIIRNEIDVHRENLDTTNPRDFIDYFIMEMKKRKDPQKDGFTENSLVGNMIMLFGAGSVTTRVTLTWLLMNLAEKQEVQEKCYREIMDQLDMDRDPEEQDRHHLPYLCATIAESQRMKPISDLNLLRQCNTDGCRIAGFDVPKGTVILQNLWSMNYSEQLWKDPENFRPERFLHNKEPRFRAPEYLTPFSYGKRTCPGMKLASSSLFLFAVCFIRKFRFLPPEGGVNMEEVQFFNVTPKHPYVKVEMRQ